MKEADFVSGHLKSDPFLKRSAFIRELLQKHRDGDDENAETDLWREFTLTVGEASLLPGIK